MKYIRTKDAVRKIVGENHILKSVSYYNTRGNLCSYRIETNRYKIANTIEELIDEWVHVKNHKETPVLVYWLSTNKKHKDDDVYGAIWTDKGLIYVAKMNNKGELELL